MARRRARRGHGQGTVEQATNGTWRIRWRENGQRRRSAGYPTREAAERVLAKVLGDVALHRAGMPAHPRAVPTLNAHAQAWLDRRDRTHRSAYDDRCRWRLHLAPHFGHLRPVEVDAARIRAFIEKKLAEGLSSSTVRLCVMLLSALFADLLERTSETGATANPVRSLPRSTRSLYRPAHDPRTTPFIEKLADVRRIYLHLPEPVNVAYAIGALAGLRTGEVLALRWEQVDLAARRMHVRESVTGPLKDKDSRIVPVLDALQPILTAWKLRSGGEGRVVPPMRRDGECLDDHTVGKSLRAALAALGVPRMTWYQATRHTFASHWVLSGGSIEKLREFLGHCSVTVTERYAHLRPDLFAQRDLATIALDLRAGGADPVHLGHDWPTVRGEVA